MRTTVRSFPLLVLVSVLLIVSPVFASESDHKYQADDPVTLWVNKVGPYNNPQETYNYYSLPFCHPSGHAGHKWGGLGEVLGGNELIDSQIDIKFQKNVDKRTICELELDEAKVKQFKDAIESSYWLEFFIDDLPLWGFVGELHPDRNTDNKHVLYTHKNIIVQYNKDQIIHVNLTQENPRPLESGRILDLTYSVKWEPTNITFAHRFDVYLDYPFFEHQIHWFSIFNSFMMVIFLTGLVSMILMRTLRNDYAKYAREDDDLETLERDVSEESGWKLVHGDVFIPPRSLVLLCCGWYRGSAGHACSSRYFGCHSLHIIHWLIDLQVSVTPRITLKPFVPTFPCFASIVVSLMDKPQVDFGLKVMGCDLMAIPGLYHFV